MPRNWRNFARFGFYSSLLAPTLRYAARSIPFGIGYSATRSITNAVRNRFRTQRRIAAAARGRNARRRMALGLATTSFFSSVKDPSTRLAWGSGYTRSAVLRVCPLGFMPTLEGDSKSSYTLFQCDERFKAMCGIYSQFRIKSVSLTVILNNPAALETTGSLPGVSVGRIMLAGRAMRSVNSVTDVNDFGGGSVQGLSVPGVVVTTSYDGEKYPRIKFTMYPKTADERNQWYSTEYTANGKELQEFRDGKVFNFLPGFDICGVSTSAVGQQSSVSFYVFMRCRIEFRDSQTPTSVSSNASKASILLDMQKTLDAEMREVEPSNQEMMMSQIGK